MTKLEIFCVGALMVGFCIASSAAADQVPSAKPLVIGQIRMTPRIRVVEQDQGMPKLIDLELRRSVNGVGRLYVSDPFFTCQWPMYYAIYIYNDDGECVGSAEMPPLARWDGETQGRVLHPGQICGRRLVLSFTGGDPNAPVTNAPLKRMRMQLVLYDGIAVGPEHLGDIGRKGALAKLSGEVVARSELVELGEIPTDAQICLIDPEHSEPSNFLKSGLNLRLEGPSVCTSQFKSSYVDVVLHNDTSTQAPLFDPDQKYYGSESSPLEREVFSRPDNTRVFHSADGIGAFGGHDALRPWEGIIKLPPHTFCGCSQPWLDTRKPGQFRLSVTAHDWIVCPLKDGKYTVVDKYPSPTLTSASFEYSVE